MTRANPLKIAKTEPSYQDEDGLLLDALHNIASSTGNIARALSACFISPNVSDLNMEPACVTDMLHMVGLAFVSHNKVHEAICLAIHEHARQLQRIADALQTLVAAPKTAPTDVQNTSEQSS